MALLCAARKPIYKLHYLHSSSTARTTEICLKELIAEAMQTAAGDEANRPQLMGAIAGNQAGWLPDLGSNQEPAD
jgi:hypothetical protein